MLRLKTEKDIEIVRQSALLLEREVSRLVQKNLELMSELSKLKGESAEQLSLRIAELERQIAKRNAMLFGASSERRAGGENEGPKQKAPAKGHGPTEQPQLTIEEVFHDLDEPDKVCPSCGGGLEEWTGQYEESEEVDIVELRYVLKKHKRKKYRCGCGGCVETAIGPQKLFPGARYSIGFVVAVIVGKWLDHLPLERQVRMMARSGLDVTSQALFDQCYVVAKLVEPAYDRLCDVQKTQPVVLADETPWPVFGAAGKTAAASKWHIWTLVSTVGVYYEVHDSRSARAGRSLLGGYQGYVVCDGYIVYESLAKQWPALQLVQCWAHVRRRFIDIEKSFPQQAEAIIGLIRELYAIEAGCPPGRDGDDERRRRRNTESREVLARIRAWAETAVCLPESGLGEAIRYMTLRWTRLTRFLDDPRLPIDNNGAERAMRGPVVGRKNHYGSRSLRGTEVAAIFYSLLESAKLVGINPAEYLRLATTAALAGDIIPLPHEVAARQAS